MTKAVKDFEDGSFHAISDGIYQLGQFISQVGIALTDCSQVGADDLTKLEAMGKAFLHPVRLIIDAEHNVFLNGVEIYKDIKAAGVDLEAGKYEQAGEKFGTVAALVTWGAKNMAEAYV